MWPAWRSVWDWVKKSFRLGPLPNFRLPLCLKWSLEIFWGWQTNTREKRNRKTGSSQCALQRSLQHPWRLMLARTLSSPLTSSLKRVLPSSIAAISLIQKVRHKMRFSRAHCHEHHPLRSNHLEGSIYTCFGVLWPYSSPFRDETAISNSRNRCLLVFFRSCRCPSISTSILNSLIFWPYLLWFSALVDMI